MGGMLGCKKTGLAGAEEARGGEGTCCERMLEM